MFAYDKSSSLFTYSSSSSSLYRKLFWKFCFNIACLCWCMCSYSLYGRATSTSLILSCRNWSSCICWSVVTFGQARFKFNMDILRWEWCYVWMWCVRTCVRVCDCLQIQHGYPQVMDILRWEWCYVWVWCVRTCVRVCDCLQIQHGYPQVRMVLRVWVSVRACESCVHRRRER